MLISGLCAPLFFLLFIRKIGKFFALPKLVSWVDRAEFYGGCLLTALTFIIALIYTSGSSIYEVRNEPVFIGIEIAILICAFAWLWIYVRLLFMILHLPTSSYDETH